MKGLDEAPNCPLLWEETPPNIPPAPPLLPNPPPFFAPPNKSDDDAGAVAVAPPKIEAAPEAGLSPAPPNIDDDLVESFFSCVAEPNSPPPVFFALNGDDVLEDTGVLLAAPNIVDAPLPVPNIAAGAADVVVDDDPNKFFFGSSVLMVCLAPKSPDGADDVLLVPVPNIVEGLAPPAPNIVVELEGCF